ncbi:hypothetical protein [Microbacterium sp.]|uniref:hypothetical protein n=1 Tax=Microbacterium sp. TaxID=51671 RepID=UPI002E317D9C|nr:hypothetical protein [Microbacterium sp.]HEX5728474.1 hypothetical protein [Microbacterium sp.]
MTRARDTDYAGALGRVPLARVSPLGRHWVLQPKVDGCYARVTIDRFGRIERVFSRAGRHISGELVQHLFGAFVGWPNSELVGELEAHTEAGNRAAAARGWRALHLFDCIRAGGRYIGREPYRVRRDVLWRMQSEVVNLGCELPWYQEQHGARDRKTGQWTRAVPTDWRLTPIVPQIPARRAAEAWSTWGPDAGDEGLVAVNLDAPLGARGGKLKVKRADTIDAIVVATGPGAVTCDWSGKLVTVAAGAARDALIQPGDAVELACDGFFDSGHPRFARLVRARPDLAGRMAS